MIMIYIYELYYVIAIKSFWNFLKQDHFNIVLAKGKTI